MAEAEAIAASATAHGAFSISLQERINHGRFFEIQCRGHEYLRLIDEAKAQAAVEAQAVALAVPRIAPG